MVGTNGWRLNQREECLVPGTGKNTRVGCHALLQGIFLTQESNQGLLHCRQILYQLSYQGSPSCFATIKTDKWVNRWRAVGSSLLSLLRHFVTATGHLANATWSSLIRKFLLLHVGETWPPDRREIIADWPVLQTKVLFKNSWSLKS